MTYNIRDSVFVKAVQSATEHVVSKFSVRKSTDAIALPLTPREKIEVKEFYNPYTMAHKYEM